MGFVLPERQPLMGNDLDGLRSKLTLMGLTIKESVDSDGCGGYRIIGQVRGKPVNDFVPYMDIEQYVSGMRRKSYART